MPFDVPQGMHGEVLFHTLLSYGRGGVVSPPLCQVDLHEHSFWQLELADDHIEVLTTEGSFLMEKDDLILIPPNTSHGFRYPRNEVTCFSIKFHLKGACETPGVRTIPETPFTRTWTQCLRALITDTPKTSHDSLTGMLNALLNVTLNQNDDRNSRLPVIVRRALNYIDSNSGTAVSVRDVADALRVSRGYLSGVFHRSTGKTIKSYINSNRVESAKKMLVYADLSITQVAEQLNYPDVFAFSRFFKSQTGQNPSHYRKRFCGRDQSGKA